jgi:hypothetical protein
MPQPHTGSHGPILTQARPARIDTTLIGQRESLQSMGSSAGAGRRDTTVLWWMVQGLLPPISHKLTANGIRSQHKESPGTRARAKKGSVCFAGNLLAVATTL